MRTIGITEQLPELKICLLTFSDRYFCVLYSGSLFFVWHVKSCTRALIRVRYLVLPCQSCKLALISCLHCVRKLANQWIIHSIFHLHSWYLVIRTDASSLSWLTNLVPFSQETVLDPPTATGQHRLQSIKGACPSHTVKPLVLVLLSGTQKKSKLDDLRPGMFRVWSDKTDLGL